MTGGPLLWHSSQQVFLETHQRLHLLCAACLTGSAAICISQQPFHRRCYCLHPAYCSLPPGKQERLCENAVWDYSSAFNTIVPATLIAKLQTLGLNRSLCSWILDFLTGRSQVVRMGNYTSSPLTLNTGAPQGCVLSPLLYSLYTHDCASHTQLQRDRQIRWRHNGDRPDHWQRWDGLQSGGEYPD